MTSTVANKFFKRIKFPIIKGNIELGFNVYIKSGENYVLFLDKNFVLSTSKSRELAQSVKHFFVNENEEWGYMSFMKKAVEHSVNDASSTPEEKSKIIYDTATKTVEDFFDNVDSKEGMEKTKKVSIDIMGQITSERNNFISMMNVSSHDYYTYTHCINVSMYAIALGSTLQLPENDLVSLAEAGILHDIGKSQISEDIINKNGPLSDKEFTQMKKHSAHGYQILVELGEKNKNILDAVLYHHEKLDGTGYPDGLGRRDIPYFAQIIAVVDVFDALTTRRSYKDPLSSFEALKMMRQRMKKHLNQELVYDFIRTLRP